MESQYQELTPNLRFIPQYSPDAHTSTQNFTLSLKLCVRGIGNFVIASTFDGSILSRSVDNMTKESGLAVTELELRKLPHTTSSRINYTSLLLSKNLQTKSVDCRSCSSSVLE
ncbi:hypothetical protein Tco_0830267 [Tanacetum coccineum]